MNSNGERKPEPVDPETLVRMLEIEMMQKRMAREQAGARRNTWRVASFFFLFIVLLAVGLALYFVFSSGRLDEMRSHNTAPATATPASPPGR
jgi:Na+/proline symporter